MYLDCYLFYTFLSCLMVQGFVINDQLIIDFWENANLFNFINLFKQYTPIENDSCIPTKANCLCDVTISVIDFDEQSPWS